MGSRSCVRINKKGKITHLQVFFDKQRQETQSLITTILEVQPRVAGGAELETSDKIVDELASSILDKVHKIEFDWNQTDHTIFKKDLKGRCAELRSILLLEQALNEENGVSYFFDFHKMRWISFQDNLNLSFYYRCLIKQFYFCPEYK